MEGQGVWRVEVRKTEVRDEVGKTGQFQMGRAPMLRSGLWLSRPISKRTPPRREMPSSSCLRTQGRMSGLPHSAVILCPVTPWEQKSSDKGLLLTSVTSEIFKSQT